jgi:hypothetical protein
MKMKKVLSLGLAAAMTVALSIPAWASTPLQQVSSTQSVNDTATVGNYGNTETDEVVAQLTNTATEDCDVDCQIAGFFTVTIPKDITMQGTRLAAHADYTVNVKGDIAGDLRVTVTPDATFDMSEAGGKADITATNSYAANANIWSSADICALESTTIVGTTRDFDIDAPLTVGSWSGNFDFAIAYEAVPVTP